MIPSVFSVVPTGSHPARSVFLFLYVRIITPSRGVVNDSGRI